MKEYFLHLIAATKYSLQGLSFAIKNELALQKEILVFVVLVPISLFLSEDWFERALLLGSWLLVIVVELINSAIETVVDRISTEQNKLSGRAKDLGSAAVMTAIIISILLWIGIIIR